MKSPKFTVQQMQAIIAEAHVAGHAAAQEAGEKRKHYAIIDDFTKEIVGLMRGSCGFGWVNVKPGNSPFANYLKQQKIARPDSYYKGVTIWIGAYGQSVEMKEAYAHAYAAVLVKHGINAYGAGRLD